MKNYKIKTSFDRPKGPKALANKTGINIKIFFDIHGKLSVIRCLFSDFSARPRTSSNPPDINRIGSLTGKYIQ